MFSSIDCAWMGRIPLESCEGAFGMNSTRHRRLTELVHACANMPETERLAWLDSATAGDPAMKAEVQSLLSGDAAPGIFDSPVLPGFEMPSFESLGISTDGHALMPERIGKYTVQGVLGRGGMAVVFQGTDPELSRLVAIKLMHAGFSTSESRKRFAKEAKALAKLHHEGIARIIEGGVHAQGGAEQPFIAMDLVRGAKKITTYADEAHLTTRERLDLLARVCSAVQHGHLNAIIHRDLKPSNILVDTEGNPKVIDFGVAKAIGPSPAGQTLATEAGQIIGTLGYMSPEQLDGKADVDTRTDVFSLGVVLYEVLTGRPPHDSTGSSLVQAVQIAKKEPERPSSIKPNLRGDIETIIFRAMEKDRDRRYQSPADLEQEIRSYLKGEPIRARPPTWRYKLTLRVRRNPVATGFAVLAVLAVVAGTSFTLRYAIAESAARKQAESKTTEADSARSEAEFEAYIGNLAVADSAIGHNEPITVRDRLDVCPERLRNWEWRWLEARSDNSIGVVAGQEKINRMPAIIAKDKGVLNLPDGLTAHVLATDTAQKIIAMHGPDNLVVHGVLSPSEDRLITWGDEVARVWDVSAEKELFVLRGHTRQILLAVFSPAADHILTVSEDQTAQIWDAATGNSLWVLSGHEGLIQSGAFSPRGDRVATASQDKTARIWDVTTGRLIATLEGHTNYVQSVAYSPLGDRIVTASSDRTARLWDGATHQQLRVLAGHDLEVTSAAFHPSGRTLVTASYDSTARLWETETGACQAVLRGHHRILWFASFNGAGNRLTTGSMDGTTRTWDVQSASEPPVFQAQDNRGVEWAVFSPSGDRVVTASGKVARVWNTLTGHQVRVLAGHQGTVLCAAYDASSDRIVTASADGTARVWTSREEDEPIILAGHAAPVWFASFNSAGDRVVTASDDRTAVVWKLSAGVSSQLLKLEGHTDSVRSAVFSPDGTSIATTSADKSVRIWSVATGKQVGPEFALHKERVNTVCFDPWGKRIVTACLDGKARVWNVDTGELLHELRGHTGQVWTAAFNPDGTRIVTAGWDKTARVWDAASGKQLVALRGHDSQVRCAAFSGSLDRGERIVTASWDTTARIWDSVPYRERFPEVEKARLEAPRSRGIP